MLWHHKGATCLQLSLKTFVLVVMCFSYKFETMLGLYEKREKQNKTERDPRASGPASLHHQATKIVNGNFFILFLNLAVKYDLGLSILARLVLISYLSSNLFCFQYLCLIWFCKGKIQSPKKKALNLCSWMKNQEMSRLMNS